MSINTRIGNPHVTQLAKAASVVLLVLGIFLLVVGVYGYLMGDLNYEPLQPLAKQVYAARKEARAAERAITGTIDLFGEGRGTLPTRLVSVVMDNAIIIFLVGVFLVFNGIMLRIQSWERMKDMFTVQPALFFFLLFVYYPIIDLVRISFTDMRMLVAEPQPFIGFKNYDWLFFRSGWKIFSESLLITMRYTF